jgi:hypothetical protein
MQQPASFWARYQQPQPVEECISQLLFGLDSSSLSPSMNAAASFFLGSIPAASARRLFAAASFFLGSIPAASARRLIAAASFFLGSIPAPQPVD